MNQKESAAPVLYEPMPHNEITGKFSPVEQSAIADRFEFAKLQATAEGELSRLGLTSEIELSAYGWTRRQNDIEIKLWVRYFLKSATHAGSSWVVVSGSGPNLSRAILDASKLISDAVAAKIKMARDLAS